MVGRTYNLRRYSSLQANVPVWTLNSVSRSCQKHTICSTSRPIFHHIIPSIYIKLIMSITKHRKYTVATSVHLHKVLLIRNPILPSLTVDISQNLPISDQRPYRRNPNKPQQHEPHLCQPGLCEMAGRQHWGLICWALLGNEKNMVSYGFHMVSIWFPYGFHMVSIACK